MTPEEKAKELVDKFAEAAKNEIFKGWVYYHKKCALIAVEEAIKIAWWSAPGLMPDTYRYSQKEFWEQVKEEIKKQ